MNEERRHAWGRGTVDVYRRGMSLTLCFRAPRLRLVNICGLYSLYLCSMTMSIFLSFHYFASSWLDSLLFVALTSLYLFWLGFIFVIRFGYVRVDGYGAKSRLRSWIFHWFFCSQISLFICLVILYSQSIINQLFNTIFKVNKLNL